MQALKSHSGSFLFAARQRVNQTRDAGMPVPLQTYWTTYGHLNQAQTEWYYFWRARLRAGEPFPTDLSYVFLHVYEVLHGVGFDQPEAAFDHLQRVWRTYRVEHPKLDQYLVPWLTDFLHYYGPDSDAARAWPQEAGAYTRGDEAVHHWLTSTDRTDVPASVFRELVAYRPEQNKFYREAEDKAALDGALRRAVLVTDAYYRDTTGASVFEALRPAQPRRMHRDAFAGAVFEGPSFSYDAVTLWPYGEDGKLSELLTQAVRYAENLARRRAGFKSMLRGIELPRELSAYLDTHLFPKVAARRSVQLDAARLASLQRDSAAIRERLLDDEEIEQNAAPAVPAPVKPALPAGTGAARYTLPDQIPEGHLTDVAAVADVLDVTSGGARDLLRQLRAQGWEAPEGELQVPAGLFISGLVDEVNEAAQLKLGDVLLVHEGSVLVAVDDYRDELEFLLGVLDRAPAEMSEPTLDAPWQALAATLTPVQVELLGQLARGGLTQRELDAFAASRHALGSALLEDLNAHALDTVGDLLIDPYGEPFTLEDTYRYDVLRLLHAAGHTHQDVNP